MNGEKIRALREQTGISQSELARRLGVTRSSVNAWESGLSAPTAIYLVELSKLFHVSTDYLLGLETNQSLKLSHLSDNEIKLVYDLVKYFDQVKETQN